MTDRARLIELLYGKSIDTMIDCEYVASYLLDNGVIVPPCKVGDTVYQIMDIESVHRQILELKVLRIEITETTMFFVKTIKKFRYNYGKFSLEDFGKTVFLTPEEAEKALAERQEGVNND